MSIVKPAAKEEKEAEETREMHKNPKAMEDNTHDPIKVSAGVHWTGSIVSLYCSINKGKPEDSCTRKQFVDFFLASGANTGKFFDQIDSDDSGSIDFHEFFIHIQAMREFQRIKERRQKGLPEPIDQAKKEIAQLKQQMQEKPRAKTADDGEDDIAAEIARLKAMLLKDGSKKKKEKGGDDDDEEEEEEMMMDGGGDMGASMGGQKKKALRSGRKVDGPNNPKIKDLEAKIEQLQNENLGLKGQVIQITNLEEKNQELSSSLKKKESSFDSLKRKLQARDKKIKDLEKVATPEAIAEMRENKKAQKELQQKLTRAQEDLKTATRSKDSAQAKLKSNDRLISDLRNENKSLQEKFSASENIKARHERKISDMTDRQTREDKRTYRLKRGAINKLTDGKVATATAYKIDPKNFVKIEDQRKPDQSPEYLTLQKKYEALERSTKTKIKQLEGENTKLKASAK